MGRGGAAAGRVLQKMAELTWPVCLGTIAWAAGRGAAAGCLCRAGSGQACAEACVHREMGCGLDHPGSHVRRGRKQWARKVRGPRERAGTGSRGITGESVGECLLLTRPCETKGLGRQRALGGVSRRRRPGAVVRTQPAARPCHPVNPQPSDGLRAFLLSPPDDLASKANILIDPLELQAATMDDLDEDEEPAPPAAQVPR